MSKAELAALLLERLEACNPSEGRRDKANAALAFAIADYVDATYLDNAYGLDDLLGLLKGAK